MDDREEGRGVQSPKGVGFGIGLFRRRKASVSRSRAHGRARLINDEREEFPADTTVESSPRKDVDLNLEDR